LALPDELSPPTITPEEIDVWVGKQIDRAMHPFVPLEEQLGILRKQLIQILNTIGLEPTPEFARLNEVAAQAVQEGRAKKEKLLGSSTSSA